MVATSARAASTSARGIWPASTWNRLRAPMTVPRRRKGRAWTDPKPAARPPRRNWANGSRHWPGRCPRRLCRCGSSPSRGLLWPAARTVPARAWPRWKRPSPWARRRAGQHEPGPPQRLATRRSGQLGGSAAVMSAMTRASGADRCFRRPALSRHKLRGAETDGSLLGAGSRTRPTRRPRWSAR